MDVKSIVRIVGQHLLRSNEPAIIVASMGRSGSTVVHDAIANELAVRRSTLLPTLTRKFVRDWLWEIGEKKLMNGVVYKTHDFPDKLIGQKNVKCVFLFGSAVEASLSVYSGMQRFGETWVDEHFKHLKSSKLFSELFEEDALRFEEQIKCWATFSDVPVLCLRYEKLWEHQDMLSSFIGMHLKLPEKRDRAEKAYPDILQEKAQNIYGPIDQLTKNLPDAFIANRKFSNILSHDFEPKAHPFNIDMS